MHQRLSACLLSGLCLSAPGWVRAEEAAAGAVAATGAGSSAEAASVSAPEGASPGSGLRLHGSLAVAKAVGGFQGTELGFGGAGFVQGEMPFAPWFGVELQLGALLLSKGDPTAVPNLTPQDGANALIGGVGVRVSPFRKRDAAQSSALRGIWAATHVGATTTGGLFRGEFDLQGGYDFQLAHGRFGLGPALGFIHVFQPDGELRPEDANVLTLGVHGTFDTAPPLARDRDRDGVLDDDDQCPDVAEDRDGFEDADGCPDLDNDRDGVVDATDQCDFDPEDKDGFEDADGCPEADNDKDGILDKADRCPQDPEDKDGFEDTDGCPDTDNDKDGILDKEDLCPNEPETDNDYADDDGCPDEDQVRVVGEHIVLDDRVHFAENTAVIRQISFPLLERLARLLRDHPEYIHIEVQGHTDQRGPQDFNEKLGKDRAASVLEFLVKEGVDRKRLSSVGFAATRVLTTKRTERALFLNRRVEFVITRNVEKKSREAAPATSPTQPLRDPNVSGTGLTDTEYK